MPSHPHELPATLIGFFRAIKSHWVSLMSGGVITVVLGMTERFSARTIPLWAYIAILGFFILLACYLAWRDSQIELLKLGNREAREREFLMERLKQFIAEYSQIDDGAIRISLENSGRLMRRDAYYKRVKGFLAQHWDEMAVEDFKNRKVVFLEELLGKLMSEQLASSPLHKRQIS
jgi:hypothetical protein